jgi:acyl carrier protein
MTREEVGQAIIEIIEDIVPDEDCSTLDADEALRDQLELDSMDFLDIVMELRKKYGVEVPEADYPQLATLNSCVEYLAPKLADK